MMKMDHFQDENGPFSGWTWSFSDFSGVIIGKMGQNCQKWPFLGHFRPFWLKMGILAIFGQK